jgi:hypothetical protein
MDNAIIWLLRLLTAHLLTDFVLQPRKWVEAKQRRHLSAREFWWHIVLTTIMGTWFTGFDRWWVPVFIFITHGLIDWWKSHRSPEMKFFIIDQLLHISVILIIWLFRFPGSFSPAEWLERFLSNPRTWIIAISVIWLIRPAGIVIGMLTRSFRLDIKDQNEESLANAGTWIGVLERLVIFLLVLIGQYEAIGLLIAAKSIIRLREGDRKMSEYVLIGTLLSVSMAILTGFIVGRYLLISIP